MGPLREKKDREPRPERKEPNPDSNYRKYYAHDEEFVEWVLDLHEGEMEFKILAFGNLGSDFEQKDVEDLL